MRTIRLPYSTQEKKGSEIRNIFIQICDIYIYSASQWVFLYFAHTPKD